MNSSRDILASRYPRLRESKTSIEGNVSNNTNSIDIPPEVDALIDDKAYYPKFRKRLREHRREIMALVEIAHTKAKPSRWFAVATSNDQWPRTLKFLAELFKVRETAERVAKKIGTTVRRFIYQQLWRGVNVERWAATAAEAGRHKAKYFTWLCQREKEARPASQ
jgi:hypothetical protein